MPYWLFMLLLLGIPLLLVIILVNRRYRAGKKAAAFKLTIIGEGEETLSELLKAHRSGQSWDAIDGLRLPGAQPGQIIRNKPRKVLRDLDSLPKPAWDLVDYAAYRDIWMRHHGYFSLNFSTTRGCPYKCNWCAKPIYGQKYNSRSPQHVVDEIAYLLKHFKPISCSNKTYRRFS